jgi:hypothetical protein
MPSLAELQAAFTQALLQGDETIASAICGDGLTPQARLVIYRHHIRTTLTDVLKTTYPVVCRLVDERFFAYAADCYIRQHPPAGPCLFEYGASFAHFLANFPPCRELVYLPDVARLEWALHAAWFAADAKPLDLECLRSLTPAELTDLRLSLAPSVSYVHSPWPIDHIWCANQPDAEVPATVSLDAHPADLEVYRSDDQVLFRGLETGTFAFRFALSECQTLEQAYEATGAVDPAFDLTTALQALFAAGLVVDVHVASSRKEIKSWR